MYWIKGTALHFSNMESNFIREHVSECTIMCCNTCGVNRLEGRERVAGQMGEREGQLPGQRRSPEHSLQWRMIWTHPPVHRHTRVHRLQHTFVSSLQQYMKQHQCYQFLRNEEEICSYKSLNLYHNMGKGTHNTIRYSLKIHSTASKQGSFTYVSLIQSVVLCKK